MLAPNMATMLAVLTTDAALPTRRRSRRILRAAVGAIVQRADRRRLHLDQRHRDRCSRAAAPAPVDRRRARRRGHRGLRLARRADGRRRRGRDQGGARPRHRRRERRRGRTGPPARSPTQPARQVLALRRRPLLGPGRQRARLRRASAFDLDRVAVAYGGDRRLPATASPSTTTAAAVAAHLAGRHVEIACDLGLGAGPAVGAHDRPRPRLHRREHGRPRDHAPASDRQRGDGRAPGRGAARTSGASPARSSSSSTAATRSPAPRRGRRAPGALRRGRRAAALGRDAARSSSTAAARRSATLMAPPRQGARVPRRAAGDRRRDARHRPHGARRQGQPRHRRRHQRPRPAGRRAVRARTPASSPPSQRDAELGFVGDVVSRRPDDPRNACSPRGSSRSSRRSAATAGPGLQHQRRHRRRRDRRGARRREAHLPDRRRGASGPTPRRPGDRSSVRSTRGRARPADRAGGVVERDDPEGRGLCPRPCAAASAQAHILDGRVAARAAARAVHRQGVGTMVVMTTS